MDLEALDAALAGTAFCRAAGGRVLHFEEISSTNTYLVEQAQQDAAAGTVCVADRQTAGRGRGGHAWHSEAGAGLYVSALLRPELSVSHALKISLAAGLAVQTTLEQSCGFHVDLRWPNDIVVPQPGAFSKKMGGLLTETGVSVEGQLRYAVIGIGLNLNHIEMPAEIAASATSARMITGRSVRREEVLVSLLHALSQEMILLVQDPEEILRRFTSKSGWALGKRVKVDEDEGYTGVTDGLDERGFLRVRLANGAIRTPRHGGVREVGPE
ncbi:biotin--[acetyl-CoA-carboxylase] ligase [Terriglobus saanensis]|uniref:biotin--[biotin carboxyl-carrier protein] ligase n=1 Tax=Terriglobus saanensis (strain ATCC BAA-1853 / DSM 23119 / SP1PR4) TaxID=401053 RepID=E8V3U4_TERSS|nr:biotin--[acetyl-CoA-carboxylase] ligase [Terriglobus saanensis]ADV81358.1 biotin/acetyl-CoA-carboxylase ligase [Terriglobus saanensis SP1PR4]